MKTKFTLICIALVLLGCSGCSHDALKRGLQDVSGKGVTKSVAEQLQEQGILDTEGKPLSKGQAVEDIILLTEEETELLHKKIISFHTKDDKRVEDYEEFQADFRLYAMNIINSPNAEEHLTELQTKLDDSKFRLYDTDQDGISDFMEMCATETSPLRKSTFGDRLDGQARYPVQSIVFLDKSGRVRVIYPELAPLVLDSINNGVITPLDGQYVVINLLVLGSELDSVRIITTGDSRVTNEISKVAFCFPVTVRISGPSGTTISGDIMFMHKNYTALTQEKSAIFLYSPNGQSATINLLTRTPTSTATPGTGKLYLDKTYNLIFPKKSGTTITTTTGSK